MTWTCEQIETRLSDYLDGLMPAAERLDFEAHANSCADCAPLLASVSDLLHNLHTLEAVEPPSRLIHSILIQTVGPRENVKGWRATFGRFSGVLSLRFAYSAISVVATVVILLTASGFSFRKPKLADLSPVNLYRTADRGAHLAYARSTKFFSDLRVVYEIQSRLSKPSDLPTEQEGTVPQPPPSKNPGSSDSTKPGSPKQQNRANSLSRQQEMSAAQLSNVNSYWTAQLLARSLR
jgi:anti-sigma factor RsiW